MPLRRLTFFFLLFLAADCPARRVSCATIISEGGGGADRPLGSELLDNLFRFGILPVLLEGGRVPYAEISVDFRRRARDRELEVISPVGDYLFRFTDDPRAVSVRDGAPLLRARRGRIEGTITLPAAAFDDLTRLQGIVRGAFRADGYLHPLARPPVDGFVTRLARPQLEAIDALLGFESSATPRSLFTRGIVMPVGLGKTVTAAHYVRALHEFLSTSPSLPRWTRPPKVAFVVQNGFILDHAARTFSRELGFEHILRMYGPRRRPELTPEMEMLAITRSSYLLRFEEFHRFVASDPTQPWVFVFDEGHHTGKEQGEFATILASLSRILSPMHRVLLLSATMWHQDKSIITDVLNGHVHGAFLTPAEQEQLRRGEQLAQLAKLSFYRGMEQGYMCPVEDLQIVTHVGGQSTAEILNDAELNRNAQTRTLRAHMPLLRDVAERIRRGRIARTLDRGVIFVPTRAHADLYAPILAQLLGEEVRALHGGETSDRATYDWLNDSRAEKRHKYVLAVDMLREGVDIPGMNVLVLLRSYGETMAGLANLIQNLRATRIDDFKFGFRLYDYTGFTRLMRDGFSRMMVDRPVHWNNYRVPGNLVTLNERVFDIDAFNAEYYNLFPDDVSFVHDYPHFDLEAFLDGGLRVLRDHRLSYGLTGWSRDHIPMYLALTLAAELPDCPEKDALITRLSATNDQGEYTWGWRVSDGSQMSNVRNRAAAERFYRAVHEIAEILRLFPQGARLDPTRLHTEEGMSAFLEALNPGRHRPLRDPETILQFIDPETGALARVLEEAGLLSQPQIVPFDGARSKTQKSVVVQLARLLPKSELRDERIAILESDSLWGWRTDDGYRIMRLSEDERRRVVHGDTSRWGFRRVFRALVFIATAWNDLHPDRAVNVERIHLREGLEKLMRHLRGETWSLLDAEQTRTFSTQTIEVIRSYGPLLGAGRFVNAHGARQTGLGVVNRVRELPGGEQLFRIVSNNHRWGWMPNDGSNTKNGRRAPVHRLYRAFHGAAALWGAEREIEVKLPLLWQPDEMKRFLDRLIFGTEIPALTERRRRVFSSLENGAIGGIADTCEALDVSPLYKEFGAMKWVVALATRLDAVCALPPGLLAQLSDASQWGWLPADADTAKQGFLAPSERIYRAIYLLGFLVNACSDTPRVALDGIHSRAEVRALAEAVDGLVENHR